MAAKKRRPKGQGTIIELGPGKWRGALEREPDPKTGKRRRLYFYGRSRGEVSDKMLVHFRSGTATDATIRVGDFMRRWLDGAESAGRRASTVATNRTVTEAHIIARIGAVRLRDLTSAKLLALYAEMREDGVGARTIALSHAILRSALGSAQSEGLIMTNPASLENQAPRYVPAEREPLTRTQARALLDAARGDPFEALYVLALTTGARQGELFALRWRDVDFEAGTLAIRRTIHDDAAGNPVAGPPKTGASRRRFALAAIALAALVAHRARARAAGRAKNENDLIFVASGGEIVRRHNFMRRHFYPMLEKANLPRIHFHDLRHTAATLAAEAGTPVVAVAAMLGHADPAITLRTYQHAFEGGAGDASRRLGDIFASKPKSGRIEVK